MNIARELGNLLSGLLAPQAPAATRQTEKNLEGRARASRGKNQGSECPAQAGMGNDRITLSSACRSLLKNTETPPAARTDAESAGQPPQPGSPLALPYLSGTAEPLANARPTAAESPATRQLVRTAYGNPAAQSEDNAPPASRIDLRA